MLSRETYNTTSSADAETARHASDWIRQVTNADGTVRFAAVCDFLLAFYTDLTHSLHRLPPQDSTLSPWATILVLTGLHR